MPVAHIAAAALLPVMLAMLVMANGTAFADSSAGPAPGLSVSPTAITVEEGGWGQFSVALKSRPSGDVLVGVSRSPTDHIAVNKLYMWFTPKTWNRLQTVRLRALEDQDAADETTVFTFTASGGGYDGMTPVTAEVLVDDDEEIGVAVSPDALTLDEGGAGQLSVALKSRPSGAVVVKVWRSTADHVSVNKLRMRFTPENWSEPQTVRLRARQDEDTADETTVFTFSASGGGYDGMTPVTAEVLVDDDEEVSVAVSPDALTLDEGAAGQFSVALKSRPSGAVDVRIWRSTADHIAVNKVRMRFTPENWSEPQTVRLRARQDEDAADETTVFTFSASGGGYGGMKPVTAEVLVNDDEEVSVAVSPDALTLDEGAAGQLSVALKSRPSGAVDVRIWRSTADHISVNKARMRFTRENWSEPQTVRLRARQDEDGADETTVFTFTASGGGYGGMKPVTAEVRVDDDEAESEPARSSEVFPTLSIDDASAAEGNADGKIHFDVRLSRPAERPVTVDFRTVEGGTATRDADYREESYTLAIPAGTTAVRASVAIVDDDIDDDGETVLVELSNARMDNGPGQAWTQLAIETPRATGTITNTDSMPRAWLARFGRTVAEQIVEAVQTRTRAARAPGAALTLAGQQAGAAAAQHELVRAQPEGGLADRLRIENDVDRRHGLSGRAVTERELLTGIVLRPHGRRAGDRLLHALGPRCGHTVRRPRGRACARRRGGKRHARRRLDGGFGHGRAGGLAQPRRGQLPRGDRRRRDHLVADRGFSLGWLCGERAALALGRRWSRRGDADADPGRAGAD